MSSDLKDARWEFALRHVESLGLEWEDLEYSGRDKLLSKGREFFEDAPELVGRFAELWRERE